MPLDSLPHARDLVVNRHVLVQHLLAEVFRLDRTRADALRPAVQVLPRRGALVRRAGLAVDSANKRQYKLYYVLPLTMNAKMVAVPRQSTFCQF